MDENSLLKRLSFLRLRRNSHRQFILLISCLVGAMGALAAIVLKNLVHYTSKFLQRGALLEQWNWFYIILPFIGIVLTFLFVKFLVRDDISHGVSRILQAISKNNAILKIHNTFSSIIASTLTVSFGGSVGLEAPTVLTGSAIGSNIGRVLRLDYRTLILFIGCGSAGAIAAIFKAPIAGVIFALEVLMLDLTMSSLIPLLISSATGATLAYFLMGNSFLFEFQVKNPPFQLENIPFYILLGIVAGIVSIYFTKANLSLEKQFKQIKKPWIRVLLGATIASLLIFLFPPLYGEGYTALSDLLSGNGLKLLEGSIFLPMGENGLLLLIFLVLILIFKVVAMTATLSGGGNGGVFAPSLFMGGVTGFFSARAINYFFENRIPETNFALAGMAGVIAGVMHAPLTATFLIAEITGGYQFFVPLMIVSIISYLTIVPFEPHSIYTKRLAEMGELITHNKDKAVLSRLSIEKLIEINFSTVSPDATLGEFVKIVAQSSRNVFPVVDKDLKYLGVVFINDVRDIIFKPDLYNSVLVSNIMFMPDVWLEKNATMEDVAKMFSESPHYNIPVLENGKYIGFVSRANVFSDYRKMIKEFSNE